MAIATNITRRKFSNLILAIPALAVPSAALAAAPDDLAGLIERHQQIFNALDDLVEAEDAGRGDEPAFDRLAEEEGRIRTAIIAAPISDLKAMRTKAAYLLRGRGPLYADMMPDDVAALLRSVTA